MRVAVVGLGKIAQLKYLPALASTGRVELHLCDAASDVLSGVGDRYGVRADCRHRDHRRLLEQDLDLLFLLTHDHLPVALNSCEAGLPVFVEKPVAWTVEDAEEIARASRRTAVPVQVGYMHRHDHNLKEFRRFVNDHEQAPLLVRASCLAGGVKRWTGALQSLVKPSDDDKRRLAADLNEAWNKRFRSLGLKGQALEKAYAALVQLGIHQINAARYAFGDPVSVVSASCSLTAHGESVVAAEIELAAGTRCRMDLSPMFDAPWSWKESLSAVYRDALVEVAFGNPFVPLNLGSLELEREARAPLSRGPDLVDPFRLQVDWVLDCVQRGDFQTWSVDDAIEDLRVVSRIVERCREA